MCDQTLSATELLPTHRPSPAIWDRDILVLQHRHGGPPRLVHSTAYAANRNAARRTLPSSGKDHPMLEQVFRNSDDDLRKEAGCTTELDYTEPNSWLLFLKYVDGLEEDTSWPPYVGALLK